MLAAILTSMQTSFLLEMAPKCAVRSVHQRKGGRKFSRRAWRRTSKAARTCRPRRNTSAVAIPEVTAVRMTGSSDIRWGSWGESAGGEEHAEPVVVAVAEAAGEAAVQLDDPVHGLSATVR